MFSYWMTNVLVLIDARLQAALFLLMGLGLLLATWLLYIGLLDGDNWTTVCGILFGSNALGGGLSKMGGKRG